MSDQAQQWSKAAAAYELDFIATLHARYNPLPAALEELADPQKGTAADLGCGVGPLLPTRSKLFRRVIAVDFAKTSLAALHNAANCPMSSSSIKRSPTWRR